MKGAEEYEITELTGKIEVYPNPFYSEVNIVFNGIEDIQKIGLYNSLGQLIEEIGKGQINSNQIKFDILDPGTIFILKIYTKDGVLIKTVIKEL